MGFHQGIAFAIRAHDRGQRRGDGEIRGVLVHFTDLGIPPGGVHIGDHVARAERRAVILELQVFLGVTVADQIFVEVQHFRHGGGVGFRFQIRQFAVVSEQLAAERCENRVDVGAGGGHLRGRQAEDGGYFAAVLIEIGQGFDPGFQAVQRIRERGGVHTGGFHQILVDEHHGIGVIMGHGVNAVLVIHLIQHVIVIPGVEISVDHVLGLLDEFAFYQRGDPAHFAQDQIHAHAGAQVVGEGLNHAVIVHRNAFHRDPGILFFKGSDGILPPIRLGGFGQSVVVETDGNGLLFFRPSSAGGKKQQSSEQQSDRFFHGFFLPFSFERPLQFASVSMHRRCKYVCILSWFLFSVKDFFAF